MNVIFAKEIAKGWLIVYMDDILIATKDNLKFHRKCIHCMLEKLKEHDLYLKLEKCKFKQWRVKFLGVILEDETVQMDPAKLKGVADWPQPQCVTDIHAFLGFTRFYCFFVPNYSNIVQPLIQLTRKNTIFWWTEECKVAFEQLKTLMCSHPILWQPDYIKAFFLATDTLAYSMGTILSQEGEINPCTHKPMLCPVAYYSATFTPTQCNYDIYEQEFLGVYMPLMKYRPHLAAMEIPVTILTDHTNLLHWKSVTGIYSDVLDSLASWRQLWQLSHYRTIHPLSFHYSRSCWWYSSSLVGLDETPFQGVDRIGLEWQLRWNKPQFPSKQWRWGHYSWLGQETRLRDSSLSHID